MGSCGRASAREGGGVPGHGGGTGTRGAAGASLHRRGSCGGEREGTHARAVGSVRVSSASRRVTDQCASACGRTPGPSARGGIDPAERRQLLLSAVNTRLPPRLVPIKNNTATSAPHKRILPRLSGAARAFCLQERRVSLQVPQRSRASAPPHPRGSRDREDRDGRDGRDDRDPGTRSRVT